MPEEEVVASVSSGLFVIRFPKSGIFSLIKARCEDKSSHEGVLRQMTVYHIADSGSQVLVLQYTSVVIIDPRSNKTDAVVA